MCDIKRISSSSHCPQASVFRITLNVAHDTHDTEVLEVCKEHYEGALSAIGMLVQEMCPFELKVERLDSQSVRPNSTSKAA